VDDEATAELRKQILSRQVSPTFFNFGSERAAYEKTLPEDFQDLVVEILARQPVSSRTHLRVMIYDHAIQSGTSILSRAEIEALIASLTDEARRPMLRWVELLAVS
jgi:hypothetical protein